MGRTWARAQASVGAESRLRDQRCRDRRASSAKKASRSAPRRAVERTGGLAAEGRIDFAPYFTKYGVTGRVGPVNSRPALGEQIDELAPLRGAPPAGRGLSHTVAILSSKTHAARYPPPFLQEAPSTPRRNSGRADPRITRLRQPEQQS